MSVTPDTDEHAREARFRERYGISPGRPLTERDFEAALRAAMVESDAALRVAAVSEVIWRIGVARGYCHGASCPRCCAGDPCL